MYVGTDAKSCCSIFLCIKTYNEVYVYIEIWKESWGLKALFGKKGRAGAVAQRAKAMVLTCSIKHEIGARMKTPKQNKTKLLNFILAKVVFI